MPDISAEVVVIGLGAMGAATLFQLAVRGARVVGVDRYAPPHVFGSSHGETRITRRAVGEGAAYVPLVTASHAIWREIEAETGQTLLVESGFLSIAPESVAKRGGKAGFLQQMTDLAVQHAIPHERLTADEITRRFPQIAGLTDESGCLELGGGFVYPERCVQTQLTLAAARGAKVLTGTTVRSVRQQGGGVVVETAEGTIHAGQAVVSAGAWAGQLLGAPFDRLLTVNRQVLHWFAVEDDAAYAPGRFPSIIWMHGEGAGNSFYGFPSLPGSGTVKCAVEQYEVPADPDHVDRTVAPTEGARVYQEHLAGRLRGVTPHVTRSVACLYTVTPDSGFIIDRHPRMDRVMAVSPCSGHGFKHSAGIGKAVAEAVLGQPTDFDLTPFALNRFPALV